MRFLADMGISPRSVAYLRNLGVDAVHLHELGLDRLPDAEIVRKARREGYVILTHDLDFGELLAISGNEMRSVRAPSSASTRVVSAFECSPLNGDESAWWTDPAARPYARCWRGGLPRIKLYAMSTDRRRRPLTFPKAARASAD